MSVQKFVRAEMQEEDREAAKSDATEREPGGRTFEAYDTAAVSLICAGCSCLCDDISAYVKNGRVVRTLNLCEIGQRRLSSVYKDGRTLPLSPDAFRDAVERAASLLRAHGPTLILGAEELDETAIRSSCALAEHLQGLWLPRAFPELRRFYERVKTFGWNTALLDEVRDQAEAVLFWRADPLVTHHRHLSRYSFFARGRFTERGNHDRNLAVIASDRTTIEPLCQQFFSLSPDREKAFVRALTTPLQGQDFDHRDFPPLLRALDKAAYTAIFLDPKNVSEDVLDALFEWSARVNTQPRKRLVILPLWNAGANIEGFCQISLEKVAAPWGADFSAGAPKVVEGNMDWEALGRGVESVLLVASAPDGTHRADLPEALAGKPRVLIDPFKNAPASAADVVIPASLPGIEHDGVFVRSDGLPLKASCLQAFADGGYPSVEQVAAEIIREVG